MADLKDAIGRFRARVLSGEAVPRESASMVAKAAYVRQEARKEPGREHYCHVPDCKTPCAPAYLMCGPHWAQVPRKLQRAVWEHYRPGQERGEADVSSAYLDAADAAIKAVVNANPQRRLF